jgi:putative ABC transport system permease protein
MRRGPRAVSISLERWLRATKLRLEALLLGDEVAAEVDEELQFHIDRQIEAGVRAGLSPARARAAALGDFGGLRSRREECDELRRLNLWESLLQDVRYAMRTARRSRGFAFAAIAVLALGIGANTAVFSVVNAVLLQPLPYPDADRIVQIVSDSPTDRSPLASLPRFAIWRDDTSVFDPIAAWHAGGPGINLTSGDRTEHLKIVNVSADYFRLFGAIVLAGRTFSGDEDRPDGAPVVVLSHGLWRRRFGGDPDILGRTILLGGRSHEIIGIIDPRFTPDPPADAWLALKADPFSNDHTSFLEVAARLKPGVTLAMAQNEVARTVIPFGRKFPYALGPREGFVALPLAEVVVGNVRPALQLLTGAVVFVLLIACANGASLLLSRASRRRAEIATRAALGARRGRLVRQLLSESLLLSLAAGALGLALGQAGVRALVAWSPAEIPRLDHSITLDGRVLAFTLGLTMFTGVVFGLLPALSASRVDLATAFKLGGENGTPSAQPRVQALLVVGEMMLALLLLVGAGLMIRTFLAERDFDRGFRPDHVLALDMAVAGGGFDDTSRIVTLIRNVELRLQHRASATTIAVSRELPVDRSVVLPFSIPDRLLFGTNLGGPFHGRAAVQGISPSYFDVFGIALRRGRTFTDLDRAGAPPVAIINEAMASRFWNGARRMALNEPITIAPGMGPPFGDVPRRIVGIVASIGDPRTRWPDPLVYVPVAQMSDAATAWSNRQFPLTWIVRAPVDTAGISQAIGDELRAASGGLPVARIRTMNQVLAASTARTNFTMMLFATFAGIALTLAATGMYALMAYSVQQRTQEIGIRRAFGASEADVRNAVVLQSARFATVGVALGVPLALVLARLMVNLVFGVRTWDPAVFVSVAALLSVVTLAAAYIPAVRATRISPLQALNGVR